MKLALFLDCYGVLYINPSQLMREMKPERTAEVSDLENSFRLGYVTEGEFIDQASSLTGMSQSEVRSVYQSHLTPNLALIELITKRLSGMYDVYVVSNTTQSNLEELCDDSRVRDLGIQMALSSELLGFTKPHPESYLAALSRAGVEPGDAVMVDDLTSNVTGAERVGMAGLEYVSAIGAVNRLEEIYNARIA